MTIFEYTKMAYQSMKDKPPKERWQYFLDYYKLPAIAVLLSVVVLISIITTIASRKDTVLSVMLLNSTPAETSQLLEEFSEHAEIGGKEEIIFQTEVSVSVQTGENAMAPLERIIASVAIKDVDIILGPTDAFLQCAYSTSYMLADLRNFYDEQTLLQYADRLYYIDGKVVEQLNNREDYNTVPTFPDHRNPENMADPIPVGIDISDCKGLFTPYYTEGTELYLGIVVNTPHPEMSLSFIDYLFS